MSGFLQTHTPEWITYFASAGFPGATPLAAGVEGAIYKLDDGTVAKVWRRRGTAELCRMQAFYADIAKAGLPFATPEIVKIEEVDGIAVTYEKELKGEPLQRRLGFDDSAAEPIAADLLVEVVAALATVPATEHIKAAPVLDEEQSMWVDAATFPDALVALLERRLTKFRPVLAPQVIAFDRKYDRVLDGLAELDQTPLSVLHGDLFGENILVDANLTVTAVLDFGFLSTAGDPRLDAAISAMIFNMYGPHARTISAALTERFASDLHYPIETLRLYQAAYALATSNFFTPDGAEGDGHFEWCVAVLNRDDVIGSLGL